MAFDGKNPVLEPDICLNISYSFTKTVTNVFRFPRNPNGNQKTIYPMTGYINKISFNVRESPSLGF